MLGLPFHTIDIFSLTQTLDRWISSGKKCHVCVINAHSVILSKSDESVKRAIEQSSLVVSDSVPIYWLSKLLGKKLPRRIAGYDLCECLLKLGSEKGYKLFFLGSTEEVLSQMVHRLKQKYPSLKIAGTYSPPMSAVFSKEDNLKMIEVVNNSKPDILWVGLSAGKHEKWIHENLSGLDCKVACGVGAAFDFFSGRKKRAPLWVQKVGMEWLFRLLQEPGRLWKRYLVVNTLFLIIAAKEVLRHWIGLRHDKTINS